MTFTLFGDESRDRQDVLWTEVRAESPALLSDDGFWTVTAYEHVWEVLHAPERFSSSPNQGEALGLSMDLSPDADPDFLVQAMTIAAEIPLDLEEMMTSRFLAAADEPEHFAMRRIVNRGFTPKRLAAWEPTIERLAAELADTASADEPWDLVSELAVPLPVTVISDILAIDEAHFDDVKRWSEVIVEMAQGAGRGTTDSQLAILRTMKEFADYFVPVIEQRKQDGGDDLISALVHAEEEDTLTAVGTVLFIFLLMVAGNETTTNLIGNMVVSLLESPDELDALRAEPDLLPNAIEESFRHRSPVQFVFRAARGDQRVGGVTIPDGETIAIVVGAANRDPDQFADPERFDIRRENASSHVALGHGIHYCLGAHLGRREATAAIRRLLPELGRRRLDIGALERLPSALVHGYRSIDLQPT